MPSADHNPQLSPVAEKSLPKKCKHNVLTYCPTMDLIALVSVQDEELSVYRLNGQRVFGGSFVGGDAHYLYDEEDEGPKRNEGEIRGVRWKNNGTYVFTSDQYWLYVNCCRASACRCLCG